jgi:hypothetical protein
MSGVLLAAPPTFETRIGAMGMSSAYGIAGLVDEVMVFRRALGATEIEQLYEYYLSLATTH